MGLLAVADQRAVIAFVDLRSEIAVVLALPHHLPAVSVKRVVDDPLGGIHGVIVLEAEMAEAFRDGFKARRFGLLIEGIVGVGAVDDPAQQHEAGSVNLYFFKIASNEHSLPWCPNSTFFTS
jgi:hypothetical protein